MSAGLSPYLNFRGDAREAMEFYRSIFGGELTASTFGEFGMPVAPGEEDRIMHSQLQLPDGRMLMGSDVPSSMPWEGGENAFSIALFGDDDATLSGWWDALSDGATVSMPLEAAPWGDRFGQLVDRFGVPWMVNISGAGQG